MINRIKAFFNILVILAMLLGGGLSFGGQPAAAADGKQIDSFNPEIARQLAEIYRSKNSLNATQRKIDYSLLDITRKIEKRISVSPLGKTPTLSDLSTPLVKLDNTGVVDIKLTVTSLTADQRKQLENLGMNIKVTLTKYGIVEGTLPYSKIETAASLNFVANVGTPGYAKHNTGGVNTAGDAALRADLARTTFGVDGSGIKIGVMSDGVADLAASVPSGDIPSSPAVQVLQGGSGNEGTAMLEIIHDLAPGSPLYFYAPSTDSDMVAGIGALEAAGCKIIVDDLTFSTEPKFEDGPVAQEARAFVSRGGIYVTSAGNSAQRHYIHQYVRTAGGGYYPYLHNYGSDTDIDIGNTFTIPIGGSIITLLQWNNQWGHSGDDFAVGLYRSSDGFLFAGSDNPQTGSGNPSEVFIWNNDTGSSVMVFIAVLEHSLVSAPSSLTLDYHVWYSSGLQYISPENSVIGHAAVSEVLSTAAAAAATPTTIESYSSRGPATIQFPSSQNRQLPNITGVDAVQTKTGQLGHFANPFSGTSAAAPHVAAIAALVWDAVPTLTPAAVRSAITSNAVDLGSAGYDYDSGYGRIDAYNAVNSVSIISAITNAASNVTSASAIINGNLVLGGYPSANVSFLWGTDSGNLTAGTPLQLKNSEGAFSANLTGLSPSTMYFFKARASSGNVTAYGSTANFTTLKELVSITVTPPNPTIAKGRSQPFSATGNYTDSSTGNITASVIWTSSNTTVAVIGVNTGWVLSLAEGSTNITAVSGNISATTLLTVSAKVLDSLAITPDNPTIAAGRIRPFSVNGTYSDTSTADLTPFVTWSSSNTSKAEMVVNYSDVGDFAVAPDGHTICAVDRENNKIYRSTNTGTSWTDITDRLPTPASWVTVNWVAVAPDDTNIVVVAGSNNSTANYVAISYNGGTTFLDMGLTTSATQTIKGLSVSALVTGGFRYISVFGSNAAANNAVVYYFNYGAGVGAWRNAVTYFTPPPAAAATIDSVVALKFSPNFASDYMAVALSEQVGGGGDNGILRLHVLSFNSLGWDNVIATGYPVTVAAEPAPANAFNVNKASISLGPDFTGGDETLRVAFAGADITAATATGGIWRMNDVAPARNLLSGVGIASVTFDGTNLVAGADNTNLVYRCANPLASTPTLLSSTIGTAGVNKVKLAHSGVNVFAGTSGTGSYFAVSTDNGAAFAPLSFTEFGLAQTRLPGQVTITAQSGSVSDTTTLNISAKVLDSLVVTSDNLTMVAGRSQQFTATGIYSDASTANLTTAVTWSSSNTTVAMVNGTGLVTAYTGFNYAVIIATSGSVSGNTTLSVQLSIVESLIITPPNPSIAFVSGNTTTLQLAATFIYTDGKCTDRTGFSTWASSDNNVATINASGLVTIVAAGTTTISATSLSMTDATTITVLPDTTAPSVRLNNIVDGQTFSANSTLVTGVVDSTASSANLTVVTASGGPYYYPVSGDFSVSSVQLSSGSNIIYIIAVDASGNIGSTGRITVEVNPNKPTVTIAQPLAGAVLNSASATVNGTISGNVTSVALILNGVSQTISVNGSFSVTVSFAEGANILAVRAYAPGHSGDSNYLGSSAARTVTLDTTPPSITIEYPPPGMTISNPTELEIRGTVNDPGARTVNIILNSASANVSVISGRFTHLVNKLALNSGNNTATVMATDGSGNSATANVTIIYDSTHLKPDVRITSPATNLYTTTASHNVTGTVSDASIASATLYLNGTQRTVAVTPNGTYGVFSTNVTLAAGVNTLEVRASDNATPVHTGSSGVMTVTLDVTAPVITVGLTDPTNAIDITVISNEALGSEPTVSVNSTSVIMSARGINEWRGTFGNASSPLANGSYTVSVNTSDKAGNTTVRTAAFCKETVTVADNTTASVQTATTRLVISTSANVTGASISVVQHLDNPSGNVRNPSGAEKIAGCFVEIVASPELHDRLRQINIQVDYVSALLPAGTDESSLKLYLWDVSSGTWQLVAGSSVNVTGHYVYGTITHLSQYGVFGTATVVVPPPPPPSGGGGGGGGGGGPVGEKMITSLNGLTSATFILLEDVEAPSVDTLVKLIVKKGTKLVNSAGYMVSSITIEKLGVAPPAGDNQILGGVYDLRPNGAKFSPPATLIIKYPATIIPEGVLKNSLYIASWNEDKQQWERTVCTNDTNNNIISTSVDHFSTYAIIAGKRPAEFIFSDLTVNPASLKLGGNVTIGINITNTGDLAGNCTLSLKVDGAIMETKIVNLDAAKNISAASTITPKSAGEHTVEIGNMSGKFNVEEAPPPPPAAPLPAKEPLPASFTVSDLTLNPKDVKEGEPLTISALVTNSGGSQGIYTALLKINDSEEARKALTLAAGKSERVTFTVVREKEGKWQVDIGGEKGSFSVSAPAPPAPSPTPATSVQPAANRAPLIWVIIGGVVVITALVYLFIRRRSG